MVFVAWRDGFVSFVWPILCRIEFVFGIHCRGGVELFGFVGQVWEGVL